MSCRIKEIKLEIKRPCFLFRIKCNKVIKRYHSKFKNSVDTSEKEIWRSGKHLSFNVPVGRGVPCSGLVRDCTGMN